MKAIVRALVDAVDPDIQSRAADPAAAVQALLDAAVRPIAANPELRRRILELRRAPTSATLRRSRSRGTDVCCSVATASSKGPATPLRVGSHRSRGRSVWSGS
jgi:hypothetical protein